MALAPLLVMCLWLGLFPQPVLELIRPDVESVTQLYGELHARKFSAQADKPAAAEVASSSITQSLTVLQERAATKARESETRK
jgi:hypothetical protein